MKFHWSQTCVCAHPEPEADPAGVYLYLPVVGTRPAFFHRNFFAPSLFRDPHTPYRGGPPMNGWVTPPSSDHPPTPPALPSPAAPTIEQLITPPPNPLPSASLATRTSYNLSIIGQVANERPGNPQIQPTADHHHHTHTLPAADHLNYMVW